VSLKPANVVSGWFTEGGGGSGFFAAESTGVGAPLWAARLAGAMSAPSRAASAKPLPKERMRTLLDGRITGVTEFVQKVHRQRDIPLLPNRVGMLGVAIIVQ